jgi:pimeloyl-ACP methyl ester carboxylesterase
MTTVDRAGVKLSYEETGSGSPPMVFVHGWTCDRSFFAPQVEHFKVNHRVLGVDLRGHGASDAPEDGYSMSVHADDIAWVCEDLEIEGAVVVGHSMGAIISVELAARHPRLVSSLVLVDAGPIAPPPGVAGLLAQLVEGLAGPGAIDVRRALVEGLFLPTDDPMLRERVLDSMLAVPDHVALGCFQGMTLWQGEEAIGEVRVPTLAVHADQPINEPEMLGALCPSLTNARTPGVGHFNQLLAATEVNDLIERFIG